MKTPTIEEKREFTKYFHALECFRQVEDICDYLMSEEIDQHSNLYKWLCETLIVSYGLPFGKNWGMGRVENIHIPSEYAPLHCELWELRNRYVAHKDANVKSYASDAHHNLLVAYLGSKKVRFLDRAVTLKPKGLKDVKALAKYLRDKCAYYTDKFEKKYFSGNSIKRGYYRLSLEREGFLETATDEVILSVQLASNMSDADVELFKRLRP